MKKFKLALIASAILVTANADQNLTLEQGWNLVGTYIDNVSVDNFKDARVLWKWKNNNWQGYSPISQLENKIKNKFSTFDTINSGEGFWVKTDKITTVTLVGNESNKKLNIQQGWNLLTLTSNKTVNADIFNDATVIWKWDNNKQKWMVFSSKPELKTVIAAMEKNGEVESFNFIKPGEGFWVYSGEVNDVNLSKPPAVGFAYELIGKLNAVPLANAEVWIDGQKIGTTDETGKFAIDGIADGTPVVIKKKGYAVAYGVIKDGKVVILTQKDNNQKVKFSKTDGSQKVAKKGITSQDGTVSLIADKTDLKKDITVSVIPFKSPENAPALNAVEVDGNQVPVDQMAIIGGALINVEDSNGNLLTSDDDYGTVSFNLAQTSILGDLNTILNGDFNGSQEFSEKAYEEFNSSLANGLIDILTLQFEDGKWVYKGKAKLVQYKTLIKKPDNSTETITKYKLETSTELNKLEPVAFVLKMNYLTGKAKICADEAGYKMFDGSIVTSNDSNSSQFSWINNPIPLVTVIGDDSVTSPADLTDDNGCVTVTYKVPFLAPTFNVALKKPGYYDTTVSCSVDADGAKCSDAKMYRIPDTASIEGYVLNKVTNDGVKNALVTLVNLEVLSADKIKSGEENGSAYVEVGYMPNITYTWTAVKYDDNNSSKVVVNPIVIKSGKGDAKYAKITEKEIYDVLVKPFDDLKNDFDAKYLTGNWELRVKAVHEFSNDANVTEEAIGNFDIDLLTTKLSAFITPSLNEAKESKITVDESGEVNNSLPAKFYDYAIYGGKNIGFLYEYGAQNDEFEWDTTLVGDASDANGAVSGAICNDYNESAVSDCKYDRIAAQIGKSYVNIAKGDVLKYTKSLYPIGYNVKFLAKHFADLLNPDPACYNDSSCEEDPFLISGFTIRTIYKGIIEFGDTNFTQYAASYADISGVKHVSDVLDTDKISLVGSSATAYMRQVITKNDGYYRINMIPPKLSGDLEIFAKAEGYKFDSNSDIKLVDDLEAGKVSEYDLYLEPVENNVSKVKPVNSFADWNFTNNNCVNDVKWQVVTNPTDIFVSNKDWANEVWDEENVSLLPDINTSTNGYVWFGDKNTGMFSDTAKNTSSAPVCGNAITPTVDLTNYSFPVLTFDSWFEVESVDVAKYQYDQLNVGFIIPSKENNNSKKVKIYNSYGDKITVNTDTYYPLDKLNPDYEPEIQDADVPYSSAGVGVLPVWKKYSIPVDGLAGYKVKFVFNFNSEDSLFNGFRGWGIDDVKVIDNMNKVLSLPPMTPDLDNNSTSFKKVR